MTKTVADEAVGLLAIHIRTICVGTREVNDLKEAKKAIYQNL